MESTNKTFKEIRKQAREEFYKVNGYYPTEENIVKLVDEARDEIQKERECSILASYENNERSLLQRIFAETVKYRK